MRLQAWGIFYGNSLAAKPPKNPPMKKTARLKIKDASPKMLWFILCSIFWFFLPLMHQSTKFARVKSLLLKITTSAWETPQSVSKLLLEMETTPNWSTRFWIFAREYRAAVSGVRASSGGASFLRNFSSLLSTLPTSNSWGCSLPLILKTKITSSGLLTWNSRSEHRIFLILNACS